MMRCNYLLLAISCLVAAAFGEAAFARTAGNETQVPEAPGDNLSPGDAEQLEARVKADSADVESRAKLLRYYFSKSFSSAEARSAKQRHILWLIENRPEAKISGSALALLLPMSDGEAFRAARALWLKQVDAHPNDPKVIGNAASFFWELSEPTGEKLLQRVSAMEPQNAKWLDMLISRYGVEIELDPGNKEVGEKGLKCVDQILQLVAEKQPKFVATAGGRYARRMAQFAVATGKTEKIKNRLEEVLKSSRTAGDERIPPLFVVDANNALGMIALSEGRLDNASTYLLASTDAKASEGGGRRPDFELASRLLKAGRKEVVLDYLKRCESVWPAGRQRLGELQALIEKGVEPNWELSE